MVLGCFCCVYGGVDLFVVDSVLAGDFFVVKCGETKVVGLNDGGRQDQGWYT